jgi:serine-type D-Ala-D-Ala carboxypeptidase (penicillin-binding protein 5/6)
MSLRPRIIAVLSAFTFALSGAAVFSQSAVIVVDMANKKIHVEANAAQKRSVGGLAKIATAIVAIDWADASKVSVNSLATVPPYAPTIGAASSIGLQAGDQMTLRDLIFATMMTGDDTAAITLGHFIGADLLARKGRQGDAMGEFVRNMNALAGREGCKNTRFTNPHGLENSRPAPYSCAADVARIALYSASRAPFHFYTNQRSRSVTIYRSGAPQSVTIRNNNPLLGEGRVDGLKSSSTQASGGCIAITADRNATVMKQADGSSVIFKHRLVAVVLGSGQPAEEARGLMRQGWGLYDGWLNANRPVTDRRQMLSNF